MRRTREKETTEERGWIGKLITAKSLGSATTLILMLNHQCPRLRCRTREPAANLLSICLLGCSSRDLQSCGCFFLICIRLQRYLFSFTFRHFFEKYLKDSSEIICLRVQHLFVLYIKNIRKGITLNPQLVAASQLVGNVGFSIIHTVVWKLDI